MNAWVSVIFLFSLLRVLCLNVINLSSESSCSINVNKLRSICHCVMDHKILSPTVPRHSMLFSVSVFVSYKTASPHHGLLQACTNPGRQVPMATKFCTVAPNICGSSVWNLFRVAFLTPNILKWRLDLS